MKSIYIMLAGICLVVMAYWPSNLETQRSRTVLPSGTATWLPSDAPLASYMGDGDANFVIAWNSQLGMLHGSEFSRGEDNMFKPYRWFHHRPVQRFVMLIPLSILVLLIGYCHLHPKREEVYQPTTSLAAPERSTLAKINWTLLGLLCLVAYGFGVNYTIEATLYATTWVSLATMFAVAIGILLSLGLMICQMEDVWDINLGTNGGGGSSSSTYFLMTTMMMNNSSSIGRF